MKYPETDLLEVLGATKGIWASARGKSILITGGTGFVGSWLVESFKVINDQLKLGAKLFVLSRNPEEFLKLRPHLVSPEIIFIRGDICETIVSPAKFDFIIHAATSPANAVFSDSALTDVLTAIEGTKNILDRAVKDRSSFLYVSTGAVYGAALPQVQFLEEIVVGPDLKKISSGYAEAKRVCEWMAHLYASKHNLEIKIARCFSFVGPGLPLDKHYAIGNFIGSVLTNSDIEISSSGTAVRSYLYSSDMAAWIWTVLLKGKKSEVYNVGSRESVSIKALADLVISSVASEKQVIVLGKTSASLASEYYVPSILKIESLGVKEMVNLETAIRRTVKYHENLRTENS